MRIADVRHWQWIVIALIVGGICGGVRQSASADIEDRLDRHGKLIVDPGRLETALLTKIQSQPLLKEVTVYPYRTGRPGGGERRVHIVAGKYWDGRPVPENGRMVAKWVPSCFLTQVPFEPRHPLPGAEAGAAARFDSVLGYLELMSRTEGVRYRYAWWWWAGEPLFVWTTGCFVVVGLLWPILINLVTFGTVLRPQAERGVSLWNVRTGNDPKPTPAPARASSLDAIERELESQLGGTDPAAAADPPPVGEISPPRTLSDGPLEPVGGAPQEAKDFRAKPDDFYPTAVKAAHPKL